MRPRWWGRVPLWFLPRGFRGRFGVDLIGTMRLLARDARASGGRLRQLGYLLREGMSLARLAFRLRAQRPPSIRGASMTTAAFDDLRWAVRHGRRRPVFSLTVISTLALSIAAAASAFGLADAVLWRALPFHDAERLVFVWEESEGDGQPHASRVTGARHAAWRDTDSGIASLSLFGAAEFVIEEGGGQAAVRGVRASANYFDTLGLPAALGRTFAAADEIPGNHRVVILSHGFWQTRFGGRPDALGETLRLSGQPYTVVGVMPPVTLPGWPVNPAIVTLDADARELWVPIPRTPQLDQSSRAHVFGVVARLTDGAREADVIDRLNHTSGPAAPDPHRARLVPLREQLVAGARAQLLALGVATLAVLLIACTNLAALYASLFESRRGELAVRAAMGASVPRLVRQLAIEASLLATIGTAGGLLLTRLVLAALPGSVPGSVPLLTGPSVDLRVVAFAIALALAATILLTGWPVARLILAAPSPRGVSPRSRARVHRAIVVAQVTVTVALTAAAGLLARSLDAVRRQHPGFSVDRMFVADIGLPSSLAADGRGIARTEQALLDAIAARPDVQAVATAYDHPLEANWSESPTVIGSAASPDRRHEVELRIVSPGYFEALSVERLDGRTFTDRDGLESRGVAVINESYALEIGERPLGRRIRTATPRYMFPDAPDEFEIVGVVGNERVRGLEQATGPAFYLSTRQFPQTTVSVMVRTTGDPVAVAADVRSAIRAVDASMTFNQPTSLERIMGGQLAPRRVTTQLIGGFAVAGIVLAALGIYGLLTVMVGSRTREIGVRLAIGASPASISRRVLMESVRSAALGVALGCGLALAAGRLIQSLLVGVSSRDPMSLGTAAAVLLAVAIGSAAVPALRAARVDPVEALRAE